MAEWAGRKGRPWRTLRKHVLERDARICQICAHPIADWQPGEVDHIVKRAHGGSNTDPDNFRAAHGSSSPCYLCNPVDGRTCNQNRRRKPSHVAPIHVDPSSL